MSDDEIPNEPEPEDDEPGDFDIGDFGETEFFMDIGKMGLTIYRAVKRDGGSENEALNVTAAFFVGMTRGAQSDEDGDSGS